MLFIKLLFAWNGCWWQRRRACDAAGGLMLIGPCIRGIGSIWVGKGGNEMRRGSELVMTWQLAWGPPGFDDFVGGDHDGTCWPDLFKQLIRCKGAEEENQKWNQENQKNKRNQKIKTKTKTEKVGEELLLLAYLDRARHPSTHEPFQPLLLVDHHDDVASGWRWLCHLALLTRTRQVYIGLHTCLDEVDRCREDRWEHAWKGSADETGDESTIRRLRQLWL